MKMKAVVITSPGKFQHIEKDIPRPGHHEALIKIEACGICHSDAFTVEGKWPGVHFPRTPGHEVAGVIQELGAGVQHFKVGDRVGVGWFGGHCGQCGRCRRGDFLLCIKAQIPGITYDGGYAEYMVAPISALAKIPESLNQVEAAPLLCAGITTFNAIRNSGVRIGDLVAILGVGGLGHLGVQFASKAGFETVAIARGEEKKQLSLDLGAHHCINSSTMNVGQKLHSLGGAKLILSTVTSGKAISEAAKGLAPNGKLIIVGVTEDPVIIDTVPLVGGRNQIEGWPSGVAADSEDTLKFCARSGVKPKIELYHLKEAEKAYHHMISGKARFRVVLKP